MNRTAENGKPKAFSRARADRRGRSRTPIIARIALSLCLALSLRARLIGFHYGLSSLSWRIPFRIGVAIPSGLWRERTNPQDI